jgi:phosphoglycolate phosphatase-like HAD superfamily hydrolase
MESADMLKGVLLDIDGTLLDSNAAHAQAWVDALRDHGHAVPLEQVRPLIGKGGDKLLMEVIGLEDESPEGRQINERRRLLFTRDALPRLQPTAGAHALLAWFAQRRLQRVVATSAGGEELQGLLKQAGIADLIDDAASSSDAAQSKPDPDIVDAALRKAGLHADEVLMLGDTPHDVEAARAAGVATVVLRCGGWWSDADFTGAVAIYDDPADLLQQIDTSPFGRRLAER